MQRSNGFDVERLAAELVGGVGADRRKLDRSFTW
jgi:hypothetical protein